MVARGRGSSPIGAVQMAVRLHDASAGLAVGIGLLKGWTEAGWTGPKPDSQFVIEVFEEVLIELRQLSRTVSSGSAGSRRRRNLPEALQRDANAAGVELALKVIGQEELLSKAELELLHLVGRESIRNVKRHSGGSYCRITLDLSTCPYVLSVRDWGAGIRPGTKPAGGITFLEELAGEMGAVLRVSSQPGLGMELTLTGPHCVLVRSGQQPTQNARLRSVVAKKSLSSRRRVAPGRPLGDGVQQIS